MQVFHQMGHNFVWNIHSIEQDGAGDGVIISPVNINRDNIEGRFSLKLREMSWFDPQFYRPQDNKGYLETYSFFPGNVVADYNTVDFTDHADSVGRKCLEYQQSLGLRQLVIPTRYSEAAGSVDLEDLASLYVEPFLKAYSDLNYKKPLLLTIIIKESQLVSEPDRDELLSWATGFAEIDGVYLIFENSFKTKQIVEPSYLASCMRFINALRKNSLSVHVGYSGLEGLLYAAADATSVSVGSYENLRSFNISRLDSTDSGMQQGPRPRIYSGKLNQWIVDTTLAPLRELYPDWQQLFDDTPYKEYLLDPQSSLNFQRSEIYKHYFNAFYQRAKLLPDDLNERTRFLQAWANESIELFGEIREAGVLLGPDSDDSHVIAWSNALAMFSAKPMP